MEKKRVYFDMDGVLADFMSGVYKFPKEMQEEYKDKLDNLPRLFSMLDPIPGAVEAVKKIAEKYEVYILSTVPWSNETGASDKINWIKKYFGDIFRKHVILSHHKELCKGDYLIDDHTRNGAAEFEGEHIHFGSAQFPDWNSVLDYLVNDDNYMEKGKIEINEKAKALIDMYFKYNPKATCIPVLAFIQDGKEAMTYDFYGYYEDYEGDNLFADTKKYLETNNEYKKYKVAELNNFNMGLLSAITFALGQFYTIIDNSATSDYCEFYHFSATVIDKDYNVKDLFDINY